MNELQALQNAATPLDLTVHERYQEDKRRKIKLYFLQRGNETVSPSLDYDKLNHFLLGWAKCKKAYSINH